MIEERSQAIAYCVDHQKGWLGINYKHETGLKGLIKNTHLSKFWMCVVTCD